MKWTRGNRSRAFNFLLEGSNLKSKGRLISVFQEGWIFKLRGGGEKWNWPAPWAKLNGCGPMSKVMEWGANSTYSYHSFFRSLLQVYLHSLKHCRPLILDHFVHIFFLSFVWAVAPRCRPSRHPTSRQDAELWICLESQLADRFIELSMRSAS